MTWVSLVISIKYWLSIAFSALFRVCAQDRAKCLAPNRYLMSISEIVNGSLNGVVTATLGCAQADGILSILKIWDLRMRNVN